MRTATAGATIDAMTPTRTASTDAGPDRPHALEAADVSRALASDTKEGLSADEARVRLTRDGPNTIPHTPRRSDLALLATQFRSPLVVILVSAGAVTLALGRVVDTAVIFGVVLLNAIIGVLQEGRAERALEALTRLTRTSATVVRDGRSARVPSEELVRGDIVVLGPGDRVPADVRLAVANELRTNEAPLTGESASVSKAVAATAPGADLADRRSMAWAGTIVVAGHGRGIVTAVGADTEVGGIQGLTATATPLETPLTRQIAAFSRLLGLGILVLAAATFAVGALRSEPVADSFLAAVALAVGAIPEGLPAAVTISLALGVSRMARRSAIVRRLPAVETLGSTTTIGTDKTGTLTRNEMVVRSVIVGGERHPWPDPTSAETPPGVVEVLRAGALANDAEPGSEHGGDVGDPTETALLESARGAGLDPRALREGLPRHDALHFSSERRLMATSHRTSAGGAEVVFVKGAPERVAALCDREILADGRIRPLERGPVTELAHDLGNAGDRVLAMARGTRAADGPPLAAELPSRMVFLGMQAMSDPPRPAAIAAVAACRHAGIEVRMITGDQPGTAAAVGRAVGLGPADMDPTMLRGRDLESMDDDALADAISQVDVFARVSPAHKLRLVRALQRNGEVVAVTGDGVNDAPALRQADIGVAMGVTGTDAAKEAADVVLLDDDFATVTAAVEEGRRVFDNITKFITWTLPTNLAEGLVILVAVLLGLTLPITPLQILWINMTTAVALGLTLAFEPAEPDVMDRPPRRSDRPILTRALIGRILLVGVLLLAGSFGLFAWGRGVGLGIDEARTLAVNAFVAGEIAYLFNCRSLEGSVWRRGVRANPLIWVGVATTIALQIVFTYAPPMQAAFDTTGLGPAGWGAVACVGVATGAVVAMEKALAGRRRARR